MPKVVVDIFLWVVATLEKGGIAAFLLKATGTILLSTVTSKLFGPKIPNLSEGLRAQSVMRRSAVEYRKIVYGEGVVSGPLIYNNTQGTNREYLWYVVALCDGEIEDVTAVYLDGDRIPQNEIAWSAGLSGAAGSGSGAVSTSRFVGDATTTSAWIFYTLGHPNQVAEANLSAAFTDWTSSHRARGVATLVVRLLYNEKTEKVWQTGAPQNIRAVVKGKKVYDPRKDSTVVIDATTSPLTYGSGSHRYTDSTTWEWSDSPALCIADYLVNHMNVAAATAIDWPSIAAAADDCASLVVVPPSASPENTETRFTCNGVLSLGASHKDNLNRLLSSCAGQLSYSSGQWKLRAAVWEASSVSYTENDLAGPIEVRGSAPKADRSNTIRGIFVDPDRSYEVTEFPIVTDTTYRTRDKSVVIPKDLELPMTNSVTMAQRVAFRLLDQDNNQVFAKLKLNARGAKCAIGDIITLDSPRLGWTAGGNILLSSEELNSIDWTSVNLTETPNATQTPWGSAQADTLNEDGTAATTHYIQQAFSGSNNIVYTFSVFLKAANRDWARIQINTRTGGQRAAYFDLANGQVGSVDAGVIMANMENDVDGWYRCSVTADIGSGGTSEQVLIAVAEGDGDVTFDGLSQASIYAVGAQLVAGRQPGLYHRTTSAAVTTTAKTFRVVEWQRNADGTFDVTGREDDSASYDDPVVTDYTTGNSASLTLPSEVVPPPTGLSASSVPYGIRLTWTNPATSEFDFIDVYASSSSAWSGAVQVASVRTNTYTHGLGNGQTRYFWIRARRNSGDVSARLPDSDTSTVVGTSGAGTDSVQLLGATLSDILVTINDAEVSYRLANTGEEQSYEGDGGTHSDIADWLLAGAAGDYDCRLTVNSGTNPTGSSLATWLDMGTTRTWTLTDSASGGGVISNNCTIEIRDGTSLDVLASATVTMEVERQDATVTLSGSSSVPNVVNDTQFSPTDANATWSFSSAGSVSRTPGGSFAAGVQWINATPPITYYIRATNDAGSNPDSGDTLNVWHALSTSRSWTWTVTGLGTSAGTLRIEIAEDSGGVTIVATGYYRGNAVVTLDV